MRRYLQFLLQSWPLLAFGFLSIFWGNLGQSFFLSWYSLPMQESLDLSAGRYGSLYSLATLGSGLLILLFGGAIDRWPLRRFAVASGLGLAAACLVLANAVFEWLLLLGFFLVRLCGQGLLPHMAHTTMARHFELNRGKALSFAASGVPAGEVLLPLLAVFLIGVLDWRGSWLLLTFSVLLIYLPLVLWLLRLAPAAVAAPPAGASPKIREGSAGRLQMLADYRFWLALPALLSTPFIITGVFIQQAFILAEKNWSPAWLAASFALYGLVHWLSAILSGFLVDRFSARALLRLAPLPLAAALFTLAGLEGQWVAPLFMTLLGVSIGSINTVSGALWAEVYGTARLGSLRSLMTSLMILSTALAPFLFGVMIDNRLSLALIFGSAGCAVLVSAVLVQFSYRREQTIQETGLGQ